MLDSKLIFDKLNIQEKISLLTGKTKWILNGVPRLGIRDFVVADGPHGLRAYNDLYENNGNPSVEEKATFFPSEVCMSSTWNPMLIKKVGQAIGEECNHYKVDMILGPGINLKRSVLAGRNFEYFSEDPYLSGLMSANYVEGVQSTGVGACVKHYILNEQETNRFNNCSVLELRPLKELYLKPFAMTIKKKPYAIMSSYNRAKIIGYTKAEHVNTSKFLLKEILRDQLGYQGVVFSDWDAVTDKYDVHEASLDIEMPYSKWADVLQEKAASGDLAIEVIEPQVKRILKLYEKLLKNENRGKLCDFNAHDKIAYQVAKEGIVLLKNENVLPLQNTDRLTIIGSPFKSPITTGKGSAVLTGKKEDSLSLYMKSKEYNYFEGYHYTNRLEISLKTTNKVLFFTYTNEGEAADRLNYSLPKKQTDLLQKIQQINPNIIVINASGSGVETNSIDCFYKGFIQTWYLGQVSGKALFEILYGITNPSGKLTETWPKFIEQSVAPFPVYDDFNYYREGLLLGYRYYISKKVEVSYPFGYGLSYTTYEYSDLKISKKEYYQDENVKISFKVKNTGKKPGYEIAQVYLKKLNSRLIQATYELVGFVKVGLDVNEEKTIEIEITKEYLASFFEEYKTFLIEDLDYQILVGSNSLDIHLTEEFHYHSTDNTKPLLTSDTTFYHFKKISACEKYFQQLQEQYKPYLDDDFFFEVNALRKITSVLKLNNKIPKEKEIEIINTFIELAR